MSSPAKLKVSLKKTRSSPAARKTVRKPRTMKLKVVGEEKAPAHVPGWKRPERLNELYAEKMGALAALYQLRGDVHRWKSYQKATDVINGFKGTITDPRDLSGIKGIGTWKDDPKKRNAIMQKLYLLAEHGTLHLLEEKLAIDTLLTVHGIGPKTAKNLIESGKLGPEADLTPENIVEKLKEAVAKDPSIVGDKIKAGLRVISALAFIEEKASAVSNKPYAV